MTKMEEDSSIPRGPGQEICNHCSSEGRPSEQSKGVDEKVTPRNRPAPEMKISGDPKAAVFELGDLYRIKKLMGQGAFGCVVAGEDAVSGLKVAIKKVKSCTSDRTAAKRLLRELRFLRELRGCSNIVNLQDVVVRGSGGQMDTYIVTDLMEADMEQIIKSSQGLSTEHVRCLTFQLLTGLKHLHARGIVHRDLKPANLVVDSQCRLKICDFGLSRHISSNASVSEAEDERFTDYVVTRWYRAPELLLGCKRYSTAVDMWAAGCILGEIIVRKPIFPGTNTSDMIIKLCSRLSPPSPVQLDMLTRDAAAKTFVRSLPVRPPTAWAETHPSAVLDPAALSLLDSLLVWTPVGRASVEAALSHPFVVALQEQGDASAQRVNCDQRRDLSLVSQRRLPLSTVTDLILIEAAHARCSPDGCHSLSCPLQRRCECGQSFETPLSLMMHLDKAFAASIAPPPSSPPPPPPPPPVIQVPVPTTNPRCSGDMEAQADAMLEEAYVVM